jgi:hypothetical protein
MEVLPLLSFWVRWAAETAPKEKKAVTAQAVDPNKASFARYDTQLTSVQM